MAQFYVYIYFDPRVQVKYNILGEEFNYKPVYIGKGKGHRVLQHIKSNKKTKLTCLNKHLVKEGLVPCYKILRTFNRECDAFILERDLIRSIGREDTKTGPLFNLTDGGDGQSGFVYNTAQRNARSKNTQQFWNSLSEDERRAVGDRSRENRTKEGVKNGTIKRRRTKSQWSDEYKKVLESKRRASWSESYCNTELKREQRRYRCTQASLKREMYYLTFLKEDGLLKSAYLKDLIAAGWGKDALEWRIKGKLPLSKPYYVKVCNETIILQTIEKRPYLSS